VAVRRGAGHDEPGQCHRGSDAADDRRRHRRRASHLAPRLLSTMVGLGIPLGLFTATGWHWLFGAVAS
jgi:hypothetical protein